VNTLKKQITKENREEKKKKTQVARITHFFKQMFCHLFFDKELDNSYHHLFLSILNSITQFLIARVKIIKICK